MTTTHEQLNTRCQQTSFLHFCYEMPVSVIPSRYRDRLPRRAQICYVSAPVQRTVGVYITRMRWLNTKTHTLIITTEEAKVLEDAIAISEAPALPIQVAPASLLPATLQDVSEDSSVWYLLASSQISDGQRLVTASRVRERLEGRATGRVYAVWLSCDSLEQMLEWDRSFERLDSHEQRQVVNHCAVEHGAAPPVARPEHAHIAAITRDELQENHQLVRFRDPVFLRKEDVLETDSPEDILEKAAATVEERQETLRERMARRLVDFEHEAGQEQRQVFRQEQHTDLLALERLEILHGWLEETEIWYTSLPRRERPDILSLKTVVVDVEEPVLTATGKLRPAPGKPPVRHIRQVGYLLLISVPADMPLRNSSVPLVQSLHHPWRTIHSHKKRAA